MKSFYVHSTMLGFTRDFLYAFYNTGIRTRLDIMYIILQHISIFVLQEIGPGACRWVRYAPESYLTWLSLHRHKKLLDVRSTARLARKLGG